MFFNNPLIRQANISDFIKESKKIRHKTIKNGFLFVGAGWCGFCQRAKPEIEKLAKITGLNIPVISVDGADNKNKNLLNLLDIEGFPTIFLIINNKLVKYEGNRLAEEILSTMCKKSNKTICFL
jgi:thiol-disulfide isomerase/thioredoxin